jgi:hypothetical protein
MATLRFMFQAAALCLILLAGLAAKGTIAEVTWWTLRLPEQFLATRCIRFLGSRPASVTAFFMARNRLTTCTLSVRGSE